MIYLKTDQEIEYLRESNDILGQTLGEIAKVIAPGVTTLQLDKIAEEFIRDNGAIPSCLGYSGYPNSICASVNEVVVHGIPSNKVLQDGDIVSVDMCVLKNGFHADSTYTFCVGEVSYEVKRLLKTTKEALYVGIEQAVEGKRVGDISNAIQTYCEKRGYSLVREMCGHGIGREMHESPEVPNYGRRGVGSKLQSGVVIAIEPMVNMGSRNIVIERDGWTARTRDRKPAAHFELSVAVREGAADILSTYKYVQEVLGDKFI